MLQNEIIRLARCAIVDSGLQARLRAGDIRAIRQAGFNLSDAEILALQGYDWTLTDHDIARKARTRPWDWAFDLGITTEIVVKFDMTLLGTGPKANLTELIAWALGLRNGLNSNADFKAVAVLEISPPGTGGTKTYRCSTAWHDKSKAQSFQGNASSNAFYVSPPNPSSMGGTPLNQITNVPTSIELWQALYADQPNTFSVNTGPAMRVDWLNKNWPFERDLVNFVYMVSQKPGYRGGLAQQRDLDTSDYQAIFLFDYPTTSGAVITDYRANAFATGSDVATFVSSSSGTTTECELKANHRRL